MAELVRDHVEIQRIWRMASIGKPMRAHLHEAVARIGVVETRQDADLEPPIVLSEMPFDPMAEITLPNVERETRCAEHMRFCEFKCSLGEIIEIAVGVRKDGPEDGPVPGRQIEMRRAQGAGIEAVRETFADRADDVHPVIGRAGPDGAGRIGNADRLRGPFRMDIRWLRKKPKSYAPLATRHLCRLGNILAK